jgi:hypothetical protein
VSDTEPADDAAAGKPPTPSPERDRSPQGKRRTRGASEQQVAEIVVAWLEAAGADVYQEVEVSGGVADIVARQQAEIWIVEVKTSLSLALIAQGMERRRLAHRVFIAAPYTKNQRDVMPLLSELGIGLLEVRVGDPGWETQRYAFEPKVRAVVDSRRWNRRPVELAKRLRPEHKTHAKAGAIGAGGRWTPFRDTCEQLARMVRREPGITLKAAIDGIAHHYASKSSARTHLAQLIGKGVVAGVEIRRSHGTHGAVELHPTEPPPRAAEGA